MTIRTEARAVLAQEKGLGTVGAVRGRGTQEGTEMSNPMMAQDVVIHESLRHLFDTSDSFDIRHDGRPTPLPEGDPLWVDQLASRFEPTTMTEDDFFVIRIYDLMTGAQVNPNSKMGVEWWREQMGDFDFQVFGRSFPNAYVRNGSYLFVSGGLWVRNGESREFRAWSRNREEALVRQRAERDAWIAAHPDLIATAQPSWADPNLTILDIMNDEVDAIEFRREVGEVAIEQMLGFEDGAFESYTGPEIRITGVTADNGVFTAAQAARISVDLAAAALILGDSATVTHVREAADAAGVTPGRMLEAVEGVAR